MLGLDTRSLLIFLQALMLICRTELNQKTWFLAFWSLRCIVRILCFPSHVRFNLWLLVFYGAKIPSPSAPNPLLSFISQQLWAYPALHPCYCVLSFPKLCPSWLLDGLILLTVHRPPTYQFLCIDILLFPVRINLFL